MFYRYDVDTYVRNVEGNFVLWEIKGRTDDGYTSSTKKVSQLLRMQFKYSLCIMVYMQNMTVLTHVETSLIWMDGFRSLTFNIQDLTSYNIQNKACGTYQSNTLKERRICI